MCISFNGFKFPVSSHLKVFQFFQVVVDLFLGLILDLGSGEEVGED